MVYSANVTTCPQSIHMADTNIMDQFISQMTLCLLTYKLMEYMFQGEKSPSLKEYSKISKGLRAQDIFT